MLAAFCTRFWDVQSVIVAYVLGAVLPSGADLPLPQVTLLNSCRKTRLHLHILWNMFIVIMAPNKARLGIAD